MKITLLLLTCSLFTQSIFAADDTPVPPEVQKLVESMVTAFKASDDAALKACWHAPEVTSKVKAVEAVKEGKDPAKEEEKEIQPLGIGVTNLAYWHAKRGLLYGDKEALHEVKTWMEHQAYYLTEATVELARERGPCSHSGLTRYGQGVFPWELRAKAVNELTSFKPELDWEKLRNLMTVHGVRNATLMAIAPVESSSVVINSTNGIEMPMSLITVKESKAGSLIQVVPEYNKLKNRYQLMWDQKDCVGYIKTAAVLAAYVDQSISTNTFYNPAHFADRKVPTTLIATNLMQAHRWGLKTFYYSLINKQGSKGQDEAPQVLHTQEPDSDLLEEDCLACKL